MKGIGRAAIQPHSKSFRRPSRSDRRPATKFRAPFTKPKLTMNAVSMAKEPAGTPNSCSAKAGITFRCKPIVRPTKKTWSNCWLNCPRLALIP